MGGVVVSVSLFVFLFFVFAFLGRAVSYINRQKVESVCLANVLFFDMSNGEGGRQAVSRSSSTQVTVPVTGS